MGWNPFSKSIDYFTFSQDIYESVKVKTVCSPSNMQPYDLLTQFCPVSYFRYVTASWSKFSLNLSTVVCTVNALLFRREINVCYAEKLTKCSSNILLCLVFSAYQTLFWNLAYPKNLKCSFRMDFKSLCHWNALELHKGNAFSCYALAACIRLMT